MAGVGVTALAAASWFGNFMGNFKPVDTSRERPAMTATTTKPAMKADAKRAKADPACVKAAVVTREEALADGVRVFGDAVADAYDHRAVAIAIAYAKTGDENIRTSLKAAWDVFKTDAKTARDTWNATQRSAWKSFEASVKACGGTTATVTDSANATVDTAVAPVQ